jgi:hypothetical protein
LPSLWVDSSSVIRLRAANTRPILRNIEYAGLTVEGLLEDPSPERNSMYAAPRTPLLRLPYGSVAPAQMSCMYSCDGVSYVIDIRHTSEYLSNNNVFIYDSTLGGMLIPFSNG